MKNSSNNTKTPIITELELEVLQNFLVDNEYMSGVSGEDLETAVNYPTWSWKATDEKKQLTGALSSLTQKEIVYVDNSIPKDATVHLTRFGYDTLVSLGITTEEQLRNFKLNSNIMKKQIKKTDNKTKTKAPIAEEIAGLTEYAPPTGEEIREAVETPWSGLSREDK
jgi:hypothetical protein